MGLAERRAAKDFETNQFPRLKQEIVDAAKFDVPVEVRWDTLALDEQAHLYVECWPKVYFEPLKQALEAITIDDMGRDALKAGLKKVVIQNTKDVSYGERIAEFTGGVLTLDHKPTTNVDDIADRKRGIQQVLEKAL